MTSGPSKSGASASRNTKVEIFDPPMCCPTGLCGPTIDPILLDVNEMVLRLRADGVQVERYQLSAQPQQFMANPQVYRLLQERGLAALPVTTVNGHIVKAGDYPSWEEVRQVLEASS